MSKLDELIKALCPDGLKFVSIGSVINYEQPSKYIVKSTDYNDAFSIPVLTAGQSFVLGYTNEKDNIYDASEKNPVIIFDDFTGAFKWVDFPFKVKSSAMKMLTTDSAKATLRYIYHIMSTIGFSSDEHKRLWITTYSEFEIPLPPLPVQREIVRILDNFTELTVELTAELTARKKQYEYYRNQLLTFGQDNEWHMLGDLFEIRNGYTPSKNVPEYWENGTVPWFRMEDIRAQGRILSDAIQHVTPQAVKGGKLFPVNSIIISTTATIGEHALVTVEALTNQQITCLTIKSLYKDKLIVKFAFYYCYILAEWCKKNVNFGGGLPIINSSKLKNFAFPIPNIEEQERIVTILDRFDTLCNDSTTGLPAEIEARKKQYDYYRDKLLTFSEVTS